MKKQNEVIRILMERDGLTEAEAQEKLDEVRQMVAFADPYEIEEIIEYELGLELDYIFDILW